MGIKEGGKKILKLDTEKLGLKSFKSSKQLSFEQRLLFFEKFIENLKGSKQLNFHRIVTSSSDRKVSVIDPCTENEKELLMFASNNYLGLANHPYIKEKVKSSIEKYGVGLGGPALLTGYTSLMKELEERLAHFKSQERAIVFPTGYSTNLGLIQALVHKNDKVFYDQLSHASFHDGLKMVKASSHKFKHNDTGMLADLLDKNSSSINGQVFIATEGVFSMDGDLAPLKEIIQISRKHNALLVLDDAHGTGVLGDSGSGTAEHFNVENKIDISMGTFSKCFAMTGGYLAGSAELINYIRYFARSYMFSASLPPTTLSAVLAGLDIIESEKWRREKLLEICAYARKKLRIFNFIAEPQAAIISLSVPSWMNLRKANYKLYQNGLFLNAIEYPAVPQDKERFRISFMATHTKEDVDYLVQVLDHLWKDGSVAKSE